MADVFPLHNQNVLNCLNGWVPSLNHGPYGCFRFISGFLILSILLYWLSLFLLLVSLQWSWEINFHLQLDPIESHWLGQAPSPLL